MRLILILLLLASSCTESFYDLELSDLEGKKVSMESFRDERLVVYVWSGTCLGHTEDLKRLSREAPNLNFKVVTIAIMMDEGEVKKVLKENSIEPNYPVIVDPEGKFPKKVTLLFLPTTILFDRRGIPIKSYPGLPEDLVSFVSSHE